MALQLGASKSNILAIMKEVAEGTPVDPTAGSDYVTLQPDITLTPTFDVLENEEIRASIGAAKPIQGLERPEMSFSHYLKHSGVEGQAPELNEVLESLFGSSSVNGTERVLAAASTVSLLKAAAGGTDFARGKSVLIKDGVNGYRIRPVHSVATNDLTLGFNLPPGLAPAAGVALGKCVNYAPANADHPSLTAHLFRGNGQAVEVIAGAKATSMSISAEAGQFINASFGFTGSRYYFDPIRVGANNKFVDFEDDDGVQAISVPEKLYRDPYELAQAIQDAMNAESSDTITVTYNSSGTNKGKFSFTSDGSTFELLWNTGANTANSLAVTLGFSAAADDTGGTTYNSDSVKTWVAPHTPAYDAADPLVAKNQEVLLGSSANYECFESSSLQIDVSNERSEITSICSESGVQSNLFTARTVTVNITALLDRGAAENFRRFRQNEEVRFCYNFGNKSGGNWVAGTCGSIYLPTAVISAYSLVDLNSVIALEMTLTGFVDQNGNGEVYLSFL